MSAVRFAGAGHAGLAALLTLAACGFVSGGPNLAQAASASPDMAPTLRIPQPPLGTPRDFALPARSDTRLSNGIPVTHVPFGTVPKATIVVVMRTGAVDEGAQVGLADFAIELMREGAGDRDGAAVAQLAAEMGGALRLAAGVDETTASLDVLGERAPDAVALLADVLRRPRLPESELPRLKANFRREVAVARAQPQTLAGETLARALWGEHPYGRGLPGDADIEGYRIEDVRRFVADEFGAARTRIYIAGRYDRAAADAALEAAFGDWAAGKPPTQNAPEGRRARRVLLVDRPDAGQSTIALGVPTVTPAAPDWMPLTVANTLLGGGLISRLNQNLREDKGWTYGASSSLVPRFRTSSWTLATDVNTPDTAAAIAEIHRELERLRTEPPPADELRRIQNLRAGTFVIGNSSRGGLIGQLSFLDFQGLPYEWLTRFVGNVYAVTPVQASGAFRARLDPAEMTLVVVGDLALVGDAVESLPALRDAAVTISTVKVPLPVAANDP